MGDIDSSDFDLICTTSELGRTVTRRVVTEIVDSVFKYHNPPVMETEFGWKDSFKLRVIAVG